MEGAGVDPRQQRWGSHSRWSLGRRYAGRGRLTCEGGDAGVVVVVSLADRTTEGEIAWEAAAAISPMRHDSVKKQRRREARGRGTGEALPASCVRPHVSWISSPWKTQGSGPQFRVSWASKGLTDCPREACLRGFLAPGIHGEPGGEFGFQTSPQCNSWKQNDIITSQ